MNSNAFQTNFQIEFWCSFVLCHRPNAHPSNFNGKELNMHEFPMEFGGRINSLSVRVVIGRFGPRRSFSQDRVLAYLIGQVSTFDSTFDVCQFAMQRSDGDRRHRKTILFFFVYLNRIMRIHFHTKFISLFWSALASSALNFHFWNCCHFTKYFRYDSVIVSYAHAHRLVGFNPKCIIYLFFSFSLGPFAGRGLLRMACTNRWWHAHQNSLHGILLERIETKEKTWLRTRRREETERERKKNHTK